MNAKKSYREKKIDHALILLFLSIWLMGFIAAVSLNESGILGILIALISFLILIPFSYAGRELVFRILGMTGEFMVRTIIHEMWPQGVRAVHNLDFGSGGDVDHVAVAPSGIFVIETKNWEGVFQTPVDLVKKNPKKRDPIPDVLRNAMRVKEYLEANGIRRYITPILVIAGKYPKVRFGLKPVKNGVFVVRDLGLRRIILNEQSSKALSQSDVDAIIKLLEPLQT